MMDVFSNTIIAWFCWNTSMKFQHSQTFAGCTDNQTTKLGLLHILVTMQNIFQLIFNVLVKQPIPSLLLVYSILWPSLLLFSHTPALFLPLHVLA